jgi:hypothetical protein
MLCEVESLDVVSCLQPCTCVLGYDDGGANSPPPMPLPTLELFPTTFSSLPCPTPKTSQTLADRKIESPILEH